MRLNQTSFRTRINIVYALLHLLAVAGIALGIGVVSNDLLKKETEKNLTQNIALACERLDALLDKIENASLHFTVTEAYKETYETSEDWSSYENFLFTSSITSHLLEFLSVQKDIYSMAFFSYDGKSFYRSFDEASAFNSSQNQEELLEKFDRNGSSSGKISLVLEPRTFMRRRRMAFLSHIQRLPHTFKKRNDFTVRYHSLIDRIRRCQRGKWNCTC